MSNINEKSYLEETIKVIRPTTSNHIFNNDRYDIVETTDTDNLKLVILREKRTEKDKKGVD